MRTRTRTAAAPTVAPTLNEEAYRRLEEMIVTLELEPGCVVSEAVLSERLGIGTTPIREALQRLSREYLVQILPRRGVVVTTVDVRLQFQVLETRRELDRLIARLAARRASPRERQAIESMGRKMLDACQRSDRLGVMRTNDELNHLMARASRNEVTANAITALHAVSRRFWFYHQRDLDLTNETVRYHAEIAAAIAAADEAAAAAASDMLIDHLFTFAKATLPES